MKDLKDMSLKELEDEIERIQNMIDDEEDARDLVLGQKGVHLASSFGKRFDAAIQEYKAQLALVNAELAGRDK